MSKTKPELSAGLIATKGNAAPTSDMPPRSAAVKPAQADAGEPIENLNFKVRQSFRRAFKAYAATHGLSQIELLEESFEALRRERGN